MNPYEVLGVRRDASMVDIRHAYLHLARQHHPDFFVDAPPEERAAAELRMRAVNEAWAVLGDPRRRRALDGASGRGFEPFSPEDDEDDPRDAPDVPYRPAPPIGLAARTTTLAPVLLFAASVAVGAVGAVMRLPGLLAFAVVLLLLSCLAFVLVPLLALARARQDEG